MLPVNGFQLGTLFQNYPALRLTLLNSCEGARQSSADPFSGVATALVRSGILAVIGMQFEISDTAAVRFSEDFYAMLASGLPIDAAIAEARMGVFCLPNWVEWATPVLYMRSPDGRLFNIQGGEEVRRDGEREKAVQDRIAGEQAERERISREEKSGKIDSQLNELENKARATNEQEHQMEKSWRIRIADS